MRNKEIFEEIKKRIIYAVEKENYNLFNPSDLGFIKKDINDGRLIHEIHSLEDGEEKIEVDFRCYDPSGPFQNLKDVNKFTLEYYVNGILIERFQDTYED